MLFFLFNSFSPAFNSNAKWKKTIFDYLNGIFDIFRILGILGRVFFSYKYGNGIESKNVISFNNINKKMKWESTNEISGSALVSAKYLFFEISLFFFWLPLFFFQTANEWALQTHLMNILCCFFSNGYFISKFQCRIANSTSVIIINIV